VIDNFAIVLGEWQPLASGFLTTIWMCALAGAFSLVLAVFVSMLLVSKREMVRRVVKGAVDVMRAIPFLLLLFIVYYCLPAVGIRLSSWVCGLFALIVYNTAYFAVVVPPPVKPGDYVVLEAEIDAVVVFSACPMDVFPTNGPDCIPKPAAYQLYQG